MAETVIKLFSCMDYRKILLPRQREGVNVACEVEKNEHGGRPMGADVKSCLIEEFPYQNLPGNHGHTPHPNKPVTMKERKKRCSGDVVISW